AQAQARARARARARAGWGWGSVSCLPSASHTVHSREPVSPAAVTLSRPAHDFPLELHFDTPEFWPPPVSSGAADGTHPSAPPAPSCAAWGLPCPRPRLPRSTAPPQPSPPPTRRPTPWRRACDARPDSAPPKAPMAACTYSLWTLQLSITGDNDEPLNLIHFVHISVCDCSIYELI
ncbi:Protein of unknown function, partial [Gryllus bimaculatus]